MKFNPVTLVLVLIALILGGVVYFTQEQGVTKPDISQTGGAPIFTFQPQQVQALSLKTQLHTLVFEKNNQGTWQMQEPEQGPADAAYLNYLLSLMVGQTSDRPFAAPKSQQEEFGFHQPTAEIEVRLDNQTTHRLIVGGYNFNRASLYAQADPSAEAADELKVLLIPTEFDPAVNRSLAEWKAPSPTPSPTP